MLTFCVMIRHHDITPVASARSDEPRGAGFLGVQTFLKPNFRIAVAPRTGQLSVQVELDATQVEPLSVTPSTRH